MKHFDVEGHLILPCTYDTLKTKLRWNMYLLLGRKDWY